MKKGWLSVIVVLTLIFSLVCAVGSAEGTTAYPLIQIDSNYLGNGQYYTSDGVSNFKPVSGTGYIAYQNGVLELNGITLVNQQINASDGSGTLEIKLVGNSSISSNTLCLNLFHIKCTLIGEGNLTVNTTGSDYAINVQSLTVNDDITLNATNQNSKYAIHAVEDILLNNGTITAKATESSSGVALYSETGSITINGANVTAEGNQHALSCEQGNFSMLKGTLDAKSKKDGNVENEVVSAKDIRMTGGTAKIEASNTDSDVGYRGLYAENSVEIGGTANVTVNSDRDSIYAENGNITISGGTVLATSTEGGGIYSGGTLTVSNGKVTVNSHDEALYGSAGVEISGGTVQATSTKGRGIYSDRTVEVSDGQVTVKSCESALVGSEGVEISGGTVELNSTEGEGIFSTETIKISDGQVTVKSCESALSGTSCVEIKGGTVNATAVNNVALGSLGEISLSGGSTTAISQERSAVYCANGTLSVTGGTLVASGKPAIEAGKSILNGDVMVYVNDSFSPTHGVKGVLYEHVNIRLDEKGNPILKGGECTKYGENFESLKPPKTGDNSRIALWAAMMVLSAAAFAVTLRAKRRSVK